MQHVLHDEANGTTQWIAVLHNLIHVRFTIVEERRKNLRIISEKTGHVGRVIDLDVLLWLIPFVSPKGGRKRVEFDPSQQSSDDGKNSV